MRAAIAALAMFIAMPASACDLGRWQPYIAEASRRYDIPETRIRAVIRAESAGCTHLDGRPITSTAGAMGLMQLMPATWAQLRRHHGLGADPHDPRDNILAGTAYLRELTDRFGASGAFAAYHAGPGRYEAYRDQGVALPAQTDRYLSQIFAAVGISAADETIDVPARSADPLFAVAPRHEQALASDQMSVRDERLFVRLRHGQGPKGIGALITAKQNDAR